MKQKNRLRVMLMMTGFVFSVILNPSMLGVARAAAPGNVVINEIGWAGSADSSTDEWIELYNTTNLPVDLAGWHIDDDHGASNYAIVSGTIAPHGYFLIEDHESVVMNLSADAIIDLSLANTGDSLQLYDAGSVLIDTVDGSGGAWYAGNATTHASMERKDPLSNVDAASNWATSTGTGSVSSGNSPILGTPLALNSQAAGGQGTAGSGDQGQGGQAQSAAVSFSSDLASLYTGDIVNVTAKVANVQNLLSYGFEVHYDPAALHFQAATEKSFLNENGAVATAFQSGLQNGQEGVLLIADARTVQAKTGVNGSGDLFTMKFDVIKNGSTVIETANGTFLASPNGDISAQVGSLTLDAQPGMLPVVTNLAAAPGPQRYSVALSWTGVAGAQKYKVYRKDAHGVLQQIAEVTDPAFVDGDGVTHGGFIVPSVNYAYSVTAVSGTLESQKSEVIGRDERGLKGDNNRSDRVDGRDLEAIAKHFAETDVDAGFSALVDTTYDGRIDGSDLIDLGANFAHTYQI